MRFLNKTFWKFTAGFAAIICLGLLVLYVVNYYEQKNSTEYQAQQMLDELQRQYQEDTYGGDTPEQTLQLFIQALKAGDTDLAAKYFVIEKQKEWQNTLRNSQTTGNLDKFVSYLEIANGEGNGKEIFSGAYQLSYAIKDKSTPWIIDLILNSATGKWKIESM